MTHSTRTYQQVFKQSSYHFVLTIAFFLVSVLITVRLFYITFRCTFSGLEACSDETCFRVTQVSLCSATELTHMWNPEMKAESGSATLKATCWEMLAGLLTLALTAVRA